MGDVFLGTVQDMNVHTRDPGIIQELVHLQEKKCDDCTVGKKEK